MKATEPWAAFGLPLQNPFAAGWTQALQALGGAASGPMPALDMTGVTFSADKLQAVQQAYLRETSELYAHGLQPAAVDDRRFADDAWRENPLAAFSAALYLINARALLGLVEAAQADPKTQARLRFGVEQWLAASAPSNFFAFNAEAQKKALETKGESIARGVRNLLADMRQGHVSMTDESAFAIGRNVALSEGAVVYENEFFQLLEYKPLTAKVHERPLLVVPPCINKFYILDLQPGNSFVRYLVEQGHRTFVVSWRNPDESLAHATWDNYVEDGVLRAISVVGEIAGGAKRVPINALGFCVGGTLLGSALAVLAARREKPVASATLLTTLLDFSDTGVLDVFVDEASVRFREKQFANGGLLKGQELASTFSFLRPNDLVWNYVVGNYLKGETPPPFDLLYWNSDSTNLPGPLYAWYLRNCYLENNLCKPGRLSMGGEKIDLTAIDVPVYLYGSREDHIVPVGGAYASTQLLSGKTRFVMGASGHIAGVINPPSKNKRSYWVNDKLPKTHAQWLRGAVEHPGSWWTDWSAWLKPYAGRWVPAPKTYGRGKYKALEAAPGRYVKARA